MEPAWRARVGAAREFWSPIAGQPICVFCRYVAKALRVGRVGPRINSISSALESRAVIP
jgi:hypothetical protein